MKITIDIIPHSEQRYPTVGDWLWFGDDLMIHVSDLGDWKQEALIGIHEAIEALLCRDRGITQDDIDNFDFEFEANREVGNAMVGIAHEEPGDDVDAPYRKEHFFATSIERLLAAELGVDWAEYEEAVNGK